MVSFLPFEVLQNISRFIDTRDKLACLTVCRAWYRPTFESLYTHVHLTSLLSFRTFLYIVAHHDLMPGVHVKKLCLYNHNDVGFQSRPLTVTELEVLARYCFNLNSFLFRDIWVWYCLDQLDLTAIWPRLHRLPVARYNRVAFKVFQKLGDRLTDVYINCAAIPFDGIARLLSSMTQLKTISIHDRSLKLDLEALDDIHRAAPNVKHLDLQTQMQPLDQPLTKRYATLYSLQCSIYHSDSAWFDIIKSRYNVLDMLSLNVLRNFVQDIPSTEQAMECIDAIFDLVKHTTIQQLDIHVRHPYELSFIESYALELVYSYAILYTDHTYTISIDFKYFDWIDYTLSDTNYIVREIPEVLYSSTLMRNKTIHHTLGFEFGIGKDYEFNEMHVLNTWITKPVNDHVTFLSLERQIRNTNYTGKKCPLYLDSVLAHFPRLISLSYARTIKFKKGINAPDRAAVTLLDRKDTSKHQSLRYLSFRNVQIDRYIYQYVFQHCPHLSRLEMEDCNLEAEIVLALEYYCLEHNVALIIK
ncbi:uncharacterized protein B0P05DRAFT_364236 [Gilbertella persicaria]|uniref:F-box domain-containing protein n=1 Tax=Rhizopus stolonifer TaxID=4846 RepID=A0A367IWZ5_RHIST|nr:uncharacterized protein B0P05DRAFT_364236 [Gilbertella persicaria]KAI8047351.1 hypothetical protein B0P05DRAFT_364236 [Gilbertella persicaria]RCH82182.1 hypothetical protein CU098_005570 [Rhizopus stolonifer]